MNNITFNPARPLMGMKAFGEAPVGREMAAGHSVENSLDVIEDGFGALGDIGEVSDPAIEASIVRDDPVGLIFAQFFNLAAPPMPDFQTA